ncbi:hypothetical protein GRK77_004915, partial [Salmonella enterica]|nr:hypothetical protein [Salmonella enterica]
RSVALEGCSDHSVNINTVLASRLLNVRLRRPFFSSVFSVYGQLSEMTLPFP